MEPSEAGAIPALSRNGDAPPGGDEPGRLARANVTVLGGRAVRSGAGSSGTAAGALRPPGLRRMIMRISTRLAAPALALVLATLAAGWAALRPATPARTPQAARRAARSRSRSGRPTARSRCPADGDRVAVPHRYRDALRGRGGRPGQGGRLAVRLPAAGAHQAVRVPAERGGDRRGKAGPGDRGRRRRAADQEAGRVLHPGTRPARTGQPGRGVRRVRRAGPGHRASGPGRAGGARLRGRCTRSSRPRRTTPSRSATTTSWTRPTTRSPRPRSSASCSACSA